MRGDLDLADGGDGVGELGEFGGGEGVHAAFMTDGRYQEVPVVIWETVEHAEGEVVLPEDEVIGGVAGGGVAEEAALVLVVDGGDVGHAPGSPHVFHIYPLKFYEHWRI